MYMFLIVLSNRIRNTMLSKLGLYLNWVGTYKHGRRKRGGGGGVRIVEKSAGDVLPENTL